jgi:UDP-N-acetylglucosamine 2-epimerase (non-hydrolysing)
VSVVRAGALASFYMIPVGHEAGRARQISTLSRGDEPPHHSPGRSAFAPTPHARPTCSAGHRGRSIFVTGNTVIDALHDVSGRRDVALPAGLPLSTTGACCS